MTTNRRIAGLEGVVAAETRLSEVDGAAGRLVLAGHPVEALAGRASFEQIVALFLDGELLSEEEAAGVGAALARARLEAHERLPRLGDALEVGDAMQALRAAVAHTRATGDARADALGLIGAVPVYAAAWARIRRGDDPVVPSARRRQAEDFLALLHGRPCSPSWADALDAYLTTVVDHGLNASTFAARVVASTGSDLTSAIVASIGALAGPLHGGAPGPVLDMLDAIGTPDRARASLEAELAAGRRIMGMGHRVYRVRDPRAAVLERAARALASGDAAAGRLALARAVEREAEMLLAERHPERPLRANVEFFTAVLLEAIGIPRELFSATFAASRVVGWCAHVAEQRATGRLIRPSSRYVGPRYSGAADSDTFA